MLGGPGPDRLELAVGPDERPDERAVVRAVGGDPVPRGDHVVQTESVGERLDQVVRRGGRQHDRPAGGPVLLEQRAGEGLDHRRQPVGGGLAGGHHRRPRRPLRQARRLAGERHRGQRLADAVEQPVQEALARQAPRREPGRLHRLGEDLARRPGEQRAIEIEERRSGRLSHGERL